MKTAATESPARRAAALVALWLLCLMLGTPASAQEEPAPAEADAAATTDRVLAHGTDRRVWAGITGDERDGIRTWIQTREAGNPKWTTFARIDRTVTGITHLGLELAVLLDNGEWRIYWDGASRLGPPLPTGYRMLTLAGGPNHLYALARLTGTPTTAPAPSTAPAADPGATTAPTTQSTPPEWALFVLDNGRWSSPIALPDDVELAPETPITLAVVDGHPTLAWQDSSAIRIINRTEDNWQEVAQLQRPDVVAFDLLDAGRGILWVAGATGPGLLINLENPDAPPIELEQPGDLSQPTPRAVTTHATSIRLFFLKDDGLAVQTYDAEGKRDSDLATVAPPVTPADPRLSQWLQTVGMVAVLFVLFTTLRHRRQTPPAPVDLKDLQLAPYGSRLAAGLIDLLPVLLYMGWVAWQDQEQEWVASTEGQLFALAAIAIYLLHTTIVEAVFGRSIGKMFFGLRVVLIDGQPPRVGALLLRNVLRIIDLTFPFLPLLAVFFMPLRQRIGDIAARTMVVEKAPGKHLSTGTSQDDSTSDDQQ